MKSIQHLHFLILLGVGLTSGILAGNLILRATESPLPLMIGPGLIFGIFVGIYLLIQKERFSISYWKIVLWVVISMIAYYAAFIVTLQAVEAAGARDPSIRDSDGLHISPAIMMQGGFVGSLILVLATQFLILRTKISYIVGLIVTGTLLSLTAFIPIPIDYFLSYNATGNGIYPLTLFVLWQGGMAAAIGLILDSMNRKKEDITDNTVPTNPY